MPPKGHKRAASSNGDATTPASSSKPAKRTRFVEPSEDPTNFAEQVDSALEDPSAHRKGRVKTEGYDSDSSDDGEGVVRSRKKDAGGGDGDEEDDDDDMFASAEKEDKRKEDEKASGMNKKKKGDTYLRLGDIQFQEFGDGSSGDGSEDEDDEPEDEDDAERRKKAGMGFELSGFNMREEMEEGKFTEDGSYVRSFDPHGVHDKWMEGLDEKEIKEARRRKKLQAKLQKQKMQAEEKELEESGGKSALEMQLLAMLKKGETVLEALQRLGVHAKKNKAHGKAKAKSDFDMKVDAPPTDIEKITHLASTVMSLGDTDVYSKTYEELVRSVRSSGKVDPSWVPPSADASYEYKWANPGPGQSPDIYGPFGEEEMRAWYKAEYFGASGELVNVRPVGGEWAGWDAIIY